MLLRFLKRFLLSFLGLRGRFRGVRTGFFVRLSKGAEMGGFFCRFRFLLVRLVFLRVAHLLGNGENFLVLDLQNGFQVLLNLTQFAAVIGIDGHGGIENRIEERDLGGIDSRLGGESNVEEGSG